jgi:hypothetical protein
MQKSSKRDSEDYCHKCGGPNISWSAPSPLWNEVMRGGDINGDWQYDEIICPTCFMVMCQEQGVADHFVVDAKNVKVKLQTTTPSGRIWDADKGLWVSHDRSTKHIIGGE